MDVTATPGTKMQFLISRRPGVTRDELVVNWFANHMPDVIARQTEMAAQANAAVPRYVATLYDPVPSGEQVWDGVAQIWADAPFPREKVAHGTTPRDTFQQKAEPYVGWPTIEYVIVDGDLPLTPNDLNEPYPCTRSGFLKVTTLLKARAGVDHAALTDHWLNVHAPNVSGVLARVGAFRYVVSIAAEPTVAPYVGMAELYFPDKAGLHRYVELYEGDGFDRYVDADARLVFWSTTEMVGIP